MDLRIQPGEVQIFGLRLSESRLAIAICVVQSAALPRSFQKDGPDLYLLADYFLIASKVQAILKFNIFFLAEAVLSTLSTNI